MAATRGMTGPRCYWHVDDFATTLAAILAAGGSQHGEITGVGGGKLIATVSGADGNLSGLSSCPAGRPAPSTSRPGSRAPTLSGYWSVTGQFGTRHADIRGANCTVTCR